MSRRIWGQFRLVVGSQLEYIGPFAFGWCIRLTSVEIPTSMNVAVDIRLQSVQVWVLLRIRVLGCLQKSARCLEAAVFRRYLSRENMSPKKRSPWRTP